MELIDALSAIHELLEGKTQVRGRIWVERSDLLELIDVAVTKASQNANSRLEIEAFAEQIAAESRLKSEEILAQSSTQAEMIIENARNMASEIVATAEGEATEILSEDNKVRQILDLQEKIQHSSQAHLDHVTQVQTEAIETLIKLSDFIKSQAGEISEHLDTDNLNTSSNLVDQVEANVISRPIDDELEPQLVGTLSSPSSSSELASRGSDRQTVPSLQIVKPAIDESFIGVKERKSHEEDSQLPFISDELFQPYDEYTKSDD
ncbi:MAG: hypothetical protein P8J64_04640 [Dehalococcoidia bacterium]|nr:hypothetical protein [Dehalococcoidia bacterium]